MWDRGGYLLWSYQFRFHASLPMVLKHGRTDITLGRISSCHLLYAGH